MNTALEKFIGDDADPKSIRFPPTPKTALVNISNLQYDLSKKLYLMFHLVPLGLCVRFRVDTSYQPTVMHGLNAWAECMG